MKSCTRRVHGSGGRPQGVPASVIPFRVPISPITYNLSRPAPADRFPCAMPCARGTCGGVRPHSRLTLILNSENNQNLQSLSLESRTHSKTGGSPTATRVCARTLPGERTLTQANERPSRCWCLSLYPEGKGCFPPFPTVEEL